MMEKVGFNHWRLWGTNSLAFTLRVADTAKHIGLALGLWLYGWGAIAKYEWLEER